MKSFLWGGRILYVIVIKKGIIMKKFFQFILAIIISFIPGAIGVLFTPSHGSDMWYNAINKSMLTPDGWVFGVAWTILYAILGIALFLIISNDKTRHSKTKSYVLFFIQMILNALWTYLFFGIHLISAALIVLVLLIAVSVWMMRAFYPISRAASYLIWPYLLWLVFALYLNGTIMYLN